MKFPLAREATQSPANRMCAQKSGQALASATAASGPRSRCVPMGRDRRLFRICEWPEETAPARRRNSRGGRACQKFDRMGRFSITKTERPRSANLLQMPRGLMCKLRQRGRDYGGPAGSRGIDPSLQPRSRRSNCLDSPLWRLWTGRIIPATQPRIQAKPQFRLRLSGFRHWCRAVRWPVSMKSGVFRSSRCRLLGTKRT